MIYWYPRLFRVKSGFGLIKCELLRGFYHPRFLFLILDISRTMQHFTIFDFYLKFHGHIHGHHFWFQLLKPVIESLNDLIDVVGFDAELALVRTLITQVSFTFGSKLETNARLTWNIYTFLLIILQIRAGKTTIYEEIWVLSKRM